MPDDNNKIFDVLNDRQVEAVRAIEGPVLILAGAGSGKTRALTHRIAYLISEKVKPENILAITFTNKAAGEIKDRVAKLLQATDSRLPATVPPYMGTFHSMCLRILRQDIDKLGYGRNFVIYDEDDQISLIKKVMTDLDISWKKFNPNSILAKISELKSELISEKEFSNSAKEFAKKILSQIYISYQLALKRNNAVDFDDLIMLCVELFQKEPATLAKYQEIFKYILVDEYQDTNHAQYVWVNLLAKKHRNLFVIGDDYQSIYAWRKADIRNILDFEKDYPEAKVIKLEQNYRSTKNILAAANNVILNNKNQKHKKLWTENIEGENIFLKEVVAEKDEGEYIVKTILAGVKNGENFNDFTILYRTHAQSRALEESMIRHGLPYRILGGVKFYQRREIKDVLAYLRLALNPSDEVSLARIYNVPGRGIGQTSYEKLIKGEDAGGKQMAAFAELKSLVSELSVKSKVMTPTELIKYLLKKIGYEKYITEGSADGDERWENVKELFTATKKYDLSAAPAGLENFLEEVALIQETDKLDKRDKAIKMMTLHSAKGLEFPVVFIAGMEDGMFPHASSFFDPEEMEEERRLCYVGITRAKKELHLTFCRRRMLYGSSQSNPPSRFIFEIPEDLVKFSPFTSPSHSDSECEGKQTHGSSPHLGSECGDKPNFTEDGEEIINYG
ncbi:MAG: UvrD-helicase domain-containing protein [Minisyncoccia bacterium]